MDYMPLGKTEGIKSFAVGHFAFGYIASKVSAKILTTKVNIPTVLMLSVIPDIDIVFQHFQLLEHRGPTHSVIIAFWIFVPIFAVYRKTAIPYFVALIQHSLVGDYIVGSQTRVLWPIVRGYYGIGISITSQTNITLEWLIFTVATIIMLKTQDVHKLLQPHNTNLILIIPISTVLLPTFLAIPLYVPIALTPPHVIYLILFLTSILIDIRKIAKQAFNRRSRNPNLTNQ